MTDREIMRSFIEIDENNLDGEWLNQAVLYFDFAAKLADARREVDLSKSQLEVAKATVAKQVRDDPENYGLLKVTERAVEEAIPLQPIVQTVMKKLIEAKHTADILSAAVEGLNHRKKALEKRVDLFLANYFSKPRASEGSRERMEEVEKRSVRRKGKRR